VLNPDDSNAWYDLGACYRQLADEELHWSATNVNSHKDLIAEYQKVNEKTREASICIC
jgi:hypothetical protein